MWYSAFHAFINRRKHYLIHSARTTYRDSWSDDRIRVLSEKGNSRNRQKITGKKLFVNCVSSVWGMLESIRKVETSRTGQGRCYSTLSQTEKNFPTNRQENLIPARPLENRWAPDDEIEVLLFTCRIVPKYAPQATFTSIFLLSPAGRLTLQKQVLTDTLSIILFYKLTIVPPAFGCPSRMEYREAK